MTTIYFNGKVDELEDKLFGFAMKLTRNREHAKDLMQETLMKAFEARNRFTIGTHFKSWMTTIMYNSYVNRYRKMKTRRKVETPREEIAVLPMSNNHSQNGTEGQMMRKELKQIIDELDKKYRVPFMLSFQGFQYDEIAEQLDLPIGTIKSRIHHARMKLRKTIINHYGSKNILKF